MDIWITNYVIKLVSVFALIYFLNCEHSWWALELFVIYLEFIIDIIVLILSICYVSVLYSDMLCISYELFAVVSDSVFLVMVKIITRQNVRRATNQLDYFNIIEYYRSILNPFRIFIKSLAFSSISLSSELDYRRRGRLSSLYQIRHLQEKAVK